MARTSDAATGPQLHQGHLAPGLPWDGDGHAASPFRGGVGLRWLLFPRLSSPSQTRTPGCSGGVELAPSKSAAGGDAAAAQPRASPDQKLWPGLDGGCGAAQTLSLARGAGSQAKQGPGELFTGFLGLGSPSSSESRLSAKAPNASKVKRKSQERWVCRRGVSGGLRHGGSDGSCTPRVPARAAAAPRHVPVGQTSCPLQGERDGAARCSGSRSAMRGDSSSPQARGGDGLGLAASCEEMPGRGGTASPPHGQDGPGYPAHRGLMSPACPNLRAAAVLAQSLPTPRGGGPHPAQPPDTGSQRGTENR